MKKFVILTTIASISLFGSSCTSFGMGGIKSGEYGYVRLEGDREGISALSDTFQGMITNGKASSDAMDTPYYELKRQQYKNNAIVSGAKHGLKLGAPSSKRSFKPGSYVPQNGGS